MIKHSPQISRHVHRLETGSTKSVSESGSGPMFAVCTGLAAAELKVGAHRAQISHGLSPGLSWCSVSTGVSKAPRDTGHGHQHLFVHLLVHCERLRQKQSPGTFHTQTNKFPCYHSCFSCSVKIKGFFCLLTCGNHEVGQNEGTAASLAMEFGLTNKEYVLTQSLLFNL